jgi:hypothetical protein
MPTHAPTGSTSASRRSDGDLRARPARGRTRHDAHDALVDLRHLGLEELLDEARIGAREDDLRAAGLAVDVLHVGRRCGRRGGSVSRGVCSREGEDGLGAAEVDDDVVALLEAPDDAA